MTPEAIASAFMIGMVDVLAAGAGDDDVLGAGVAGVYGVHTDPAVRARGLGPVLTRAPMREARDAGYEIAGFRTVCEVGIYEREPGATGA